MPTVRKRWRRLSIRWMTSRLGYRINIFLARMCFRGIYFPMMGKLAWVKVIAQNRRTIFKLVKEAVFRYGLQRPPNPEGVSYEEAPAPETHAA